MESRVVRFPVSAFLAVASAVELASCQDPAPPAPVVTPALKAPAAPAAPPKPKAGKLTEMDLESFLQHQQAGDLLIYDARPGFVAAFGRVPGAISWPKGDFNGQLSRREPEIREAVKSGKRVVIYCTDAACPDARSVGERLAARGHDVSILAGGFAAWKEAGLPTE